VSVRNLEKIFNPRRIALFGACDVGKSLGLAVLGNLLHSAFRGVIYPINDRCESIHGVATYADPDRLPKVPDLAVICNPAPEVAAVVEVCGRLGIGAALILSGGFRETGPAGAAIEAEVIAAARRFENMRVLGPNSLGVIAPTIGFNASHAVTMPRAGHLAFISESRGLCNSVIDWATEGGIGFSAFVSTGNRVNVGFGDLIDYFGKDPQTRAIILYMQSVDHARSFMSAARAFAMTKPIVVCKAGRFEESVEAVSSHTGDLVGEDAVFEAAFQRCGVVRVEELDDVFDVAEVLASQRQPKGARLAIVSNAGGPAIIATDALIARGGELARFDASTVAGLDEALPAEGQHTNPVDLLDDAPAERFRKALSLVLADGNVDAVLAIFAIQSDVDPEETARVVADVARKATKPVLAAWMGGERACRGIRILNESGLPTHRSPEQAVRAFSHLVTYSRNLEALYETPRDVPVRFDLNRRKLRKRLQPLLRERRHAPVNQAWAFLKAYGIPVCDACMATNAAEAVRAADHVGYPVALKVLSPQILHKLDVGGVALDLKGPEQVVEAFEEILRATRTHRPDAKIHGVNVQSMVKAQGIEMILGAKKDPTFGAVIMVGMGGIATSVLRDWAVGLPPLNERLVRRMLESLRSWPMLNGYRGLPAANVELLVEVIIRFSLLIADYPEIREFDVNPLRVTAQDVTALDAAMLLDETRHALAQQYPHLAIRPYPEELVRYGRTSDYATVTLRAVRAEDEPLWHELVASSSEESIRFRFRSLLKRTTHQMAVAQCVIDYERNICIVAETEARGKRELVGIAHLLADPNHETAEFAVLVPDPWQGKKIGGMLLDYCMDLAGTWGITKIVAETDPQNTRMLDTFKKRGFRYEVHLDDDVVLLERDVSPALKRSIGG
jgi:acetyltransferase